MFLYLDIWVLHGLLCFRHNLEIESTRKANETEDPQRVVVEGLEGRKGGADEFVPHVLETAACEILNFLRMEIVEEGVDGAVAAEGVLHGGPEFLHSVSTAVNSHNMERCPTYHLWNSTIRSVSLAPQIDQVNIQSHDPGRCRLQMFALLRIALNLVQGRRRDVVAFLVTVQKASQTVPKVKSSHPVDADIDVVAPDAEQLVTHPASGEAQHDGLGVWWGGGVDVGADINEELPYGCFPTGKED